MRRASVLLAAGALLVALPGASAAAGPAGPAGPKWRPDVRAARTYAAARSGEVSFALRTPRRLYGYRARRTAPSASVVKAMLMVAYLNRAEVRRRRLTGGELGLLGPMIRRSSNRAANRVHGVVGSDSLERLARRVGMRDFASHEVWGLTQITAADQAKLWLRIDRLVVRRHRETALRLLGSVVARQRWGIARARPKGWALYFKGGWVTGVEHQAALLRRGRRRVAVTVLTTGSPSSAYGRRTQRGVARRLLRGLGPGSVPR